VPSPNRPETPEILTFGPFRFDRRNGLLQSDGTEVALAAKARDLLECLLEQPGNVVPKEELLERVWGDTAVTEHSLTEGVRALRKVLGDDPRRPRFIQTVHRKGYRFIAPVTGDDEQPGDATAPVPIPAAELGGTAFARTGWGPAAWVLTGTGVGAILVGALVWFSPGDAPPPPQRTEFRITAPEGAFFPTSTVQSLVITPDGSTLMYVVLSEFSGGALYEHPLGGGEARPIPATRGVPVGNGFISADGKRLGFLQNWWVKVLSLTDGEIMELCEKCIFATPSIEPEGGTWAGDDTIVFASRDSLMKISTQGGKPQLLIGPAPENTGGGYLLPSPLPGGEWILATLRHGRAAEGAQIMVVNVETGEHAVVVENGVNAQYVASGHVVFVRDGDLWAVPFDLELRTPTGEPRFVRPGLLMSADNGLAHFTVSLTGTLAYIPGAAYSKTYNIISTDRANNRQTLIEDRRTFNDVRMSPDGTKLAVETLDGNDTDIWIYDLETRTHIRSFGSKGTDESAPIWSPDGSRVAFASQDGVTSTIYWAPVDGESPDAFAGTDIVSMTGPSLIPTSWSPDGHIAYAVTTEGGWDIWTVEIASGAAKPFAQTPRHEKSAAFSPDGLWLAYSSDSEADESYVVRVAAFPLDDREIAEVDAWGDQLHWSQDGREIFYAGPGLWRIPVFSEPRSEPGFRLGDPEKLGVTGLYSHRFGVSPDGDRFVFTDDRSYASPRATEIVVVVNWFEELNRLVPLQR